MNIKSIALFANVLVLSTSVNAALIDNGIYTTDMDSGLDWLDLTETSRMPYDFVSSQLGVGGAFEGWSYATVVQIESLFDSAGGTGPYTGWSSTNNGVVLPLLNLWATSSSFVSYNFFTVVPGTVLGTHRFGSVSDNPTISRSLTEDFLISDSGNLGDSTADIAIGSALVRVSVVPIPPAVWLFGSGLIGLIGVARRKAYT